MVMKSVGEKLRGERVQRGIDLETLAEMTRINARYLEAIESGKPDDLPGGFFYRSFVRQYATALNLDMDEIEADLERAKEAEAPILGAALNENRFPIKQPDAIVQESNRRSGSGRMGAYVVLLAAVVVGSSLVYGWWNRMETSAAARSDESQQVAPQTTAFDPSQPTETAATAQEPVPTGPVGVPVTAAPQDEGAIQPASSTTSAASTEDRVVLNLTARENTWVSVTVDGKVAFVGVLAANEVKTLGGKESAKLRTGNAGALEVTWNGKNIGPIGPRGQVRTLELTPSAYIVIGPTRPAEAQGQDPTGSL
jgi:cytoskeleton protein RodZ